MLGPYESAVSMKLMSRPGRRRKVRNASARSVGGPQMPGPVMRMLPKPRRLTLVLPSILNAPAFAAETLLLMRLPLAHTRLVEELRLRSTLNTLYFELQHIVYGTF